MVLPWLTKSPTPAHTVKSQSIINWKTRSLIFINCKLSAYFYHIIFHAYGHICNILLAKPPHSMIQVLQRRSWDFFEKYKEYGSNYTFQKRGGAETMKPPPPSVPTLKSVFSPLSPSLQSTSMVAGKST